MDRKQRWRDHFVNSILRKRKISLLKNCFLEGLSAKPAAWPIISLNCIKNSHCEVVSTDSGFYRQVLATEFVELSTIIYVFQTFWLYGIISHILHFCFCHSSFYLSFSKSENDSLHQYFSVAAVQIKNVRCIVSPGVASYGRDGKEQFERGLPTSPILSLFY